MTTFIAAWLALPAAADPREERACAAFGEVVPASFPCTAVASSAPGQPGLQVTLEVARGGRPPFREVPLPTPVCNGDLVEFTFTPTYEGFLTLLSHGTSGRWTRHVPARVGEVARFSTEAPARFPASGQGFVVTGEPGTEYLMLFVSDKPFSAALQRQINVLHGSYSPPEGGGIAAAPHRALLLLGDPKQPGAFVASSGEQSVALPLSHAEDCPPL